MQKQTSIFDMLPPEVIEMLRKMIYDEWKGPAQGSTITLGPTPRILSGKMWKPICIEDIFKQPLWFPACAICARPILELKFKVTCVSEIDGHEIRVEITKICCPKHISFKKISYHDFRHMRRAVAAVNAYEII